MKIKNVIEKKDRPITIAGPCSAESEDQILMTAKALAAQGVDLFRAGVWKPRTSPGSFEGVGSIGLKWLARAKAETGIKVTTEVANPHHVIEALRTGIDVLWIGARTTVSPFAIQEMANVLKGVDIPVLIKNPVNPDLKLWIGAIERIYNAGIRKIGVIHRGFSFFGNSKYRNVPRWQLPIELKRQLPEIQIFIDSSHICGNTELLFDVAQKAMDLNYDGLMLEVHPNPPKAFSDAKQQIVPADFEKLVNNLVIRDLKSENGIALKHLRQQIDEIDDELFQILAKRLEVVKNIGHYKKNNNIAILQPKRWNDILEKGFEKAEHLGLSREFISAYLKAIHQESINVQEDILKKR